MNFVNAMQGELRNTIAIIVHVWEYLHFELKT